MSFDLVHIMPEQIIAFWFTEIEPKSWWKVDPDFDLKVRTRFEGVLQQAVKGELANWRAQPKGRLAEIIVLDQFSRNIYRNTPLAFAQDAIALVLSQEAVSAGALVGLEPIECAFILMPLMHSESKLIHEQAQALFHEHAPKDNHDFELRHKAIIDRFGRYPHRNAILGRSSTAEELEFLKQPGSGF